MNASYEWLRAFIPLEASPTQLRDLLTSHTATVEELQPLRADLAPIVVARVVEAGRHPDSDHLWLTRVDAGTGELSEVVCGAPNVEAGKLYPFAPVGTTMPNGMKIERRKIRGVVSNGMLCSARELGLGEDQAGILELQTEAAPGTPLLSVMPIGDTRLVIDVGANRPDLLSHLGLARELAAISGETWRLPDIPGLTTASPKARTVAKGPVAGVEVRVDPESKTRRYMAAVIRGLQIGPSPEWLVRRLDAVGVRSISNVVDATNYVLHELGQPVHAFDLGKLAGGSVVVRLARANEQLITLDGISRRLNAETVVIADADRAQAIAGIMGGRDSEVTGDTRDILIEVASFDPKRTRAARRSLGLSTDASYRFERGVDPELAGMAMDRVIRLILSLAGGALAEPTFDVARASAPAGQPTITVRAKRIVQVLGAEVPLDRARRYLEGAGFETVSRSDRELTVRVPTWRSDVTSEIDLVEDVARFHGYHAFPDEIRPFRPTTTHDAQLWIVSNRLRDTLVGLGLLETRPMPFVQGGDDTHVRVGNPLSANEAFLRGAILETLARRAEFNLSQRSGDVRIFEIGSVFAPTTTAMPREQLRLGVLIMGRRRPGHFTEPQPPAFDAWDAKAVAEVAAAAAYPGQRIELAPATGNVLWHIRAAGRAVGNVTRVTLDAPVWAASAFGLELVLGEISTAPAAEPGTHAYAKDRRPEQLPPSRYVPLPTMPSAEFDLALLVPREHMADDVERVIRSAAGELLERLELFDQYTGAGVPPDYRSLAWRLTFRHPERTLRDKEIEGRRGRILDALEQELHVRQRST